MPSSDVVDLRMDLRDELLERVRRRGTTLRRRRRVLQSAPAVLLTAVVLGLAWSSDTIARRRVQVTSEGVTVPAIVADDPSSPDETMATTTTTPTSTSMADDTSESDSRARRRSVLLVTPTTRGSGMAPTSASGGAEDGSTPRPGGSGATSPGTTGTSPTMGPPTSSAPSTTTTASTTRACMNSFDASCGAFRWDPERSYKHPTITVRHEPRNPKVGERITYYITVDDVDSPHVWGAIRASRPWPGAYTGCRTAYGPWKVPSPQAGSGSFIDYQTWAISGTFTVYFDAVSWSYTSPDGSPGDTEGNCLDPYSGSTIYEYEITVSE